MGGVTGVDVVARSPPDGYTIGLSSAGALSIMPFMMSKMPFDWRKDLALLTLVARVPEVLVVHPALKLATLQDPRGLREAFVGPLSYLLGAAAAWINTPGAFVIYALTPLFYITPTHGRRQAPNEKASVERS